MSFSSDRGQQIVEFSLNQGFLGLVGEEECWVLFSHPCQSNLHLSDQMQPGKNFMLFKHICCTTGLVISVPIHMEQMWDKSESIINK